jgi:hypothetical protein
VALVEADLCPPNKLAHLSILLRLVMRNGRDSWLRMQAAERGNRKSRLTNPASSIRGGSAVLDGSLAFGRALALLECRCEPRGAAWSNVKVAAWGLALKKHTLSDCDLRNLSRADEGAVGGRGKAERIAAVVAIATKF